MRSVLALLFVLAAVEPARVEPKLARLFRDHMVLQRNLVIPIWGAPNESANLNKRFGPERVRSTKGRTLDD